MTIGVYADPLKIFTSAMPQRGVLKKMIEERKEDRFIFFLHKRTYNDPVIIQYFEELRPYNNWEISLLSIPYKLTRVIQLVGFEYPRLNKKADVYFSSDIETFGKHKHPVVNYLPDMSVYDDPRHTSLSRFSNFFRRKSTTKMALQSDCVIVISQFTADRFAFRFPSQAHKLRLVYNGIDDKWFSHAVKVDRPAMRYWIWMGGSYNSRKNLDRLLLAYQKMLKQHPGAEIPKIVFAGLNNDSISRLKVVSEGLALESKTEFMPKIPLEELIQLVDHSEGLLFPSIYEGFGLPVMESFSRGRAVLTSDKASLSEIANGKAVLCNPYEVDSIYTGLLRMLEPAENSEVLVKSRKEWAAMFTYSAAAGKIYSIFEGLKERKPGHS